MNKQLILKRMAACATLALLFGGAVAQNTTAGTAPGATASTAAVASADQK